MSIVKTAVIAVVAVMVAKLVLPMIPGLNALAKYL